MSTSISLTSLRIAGFWRRLSAKIVDGFVIGAPVLGIQAALSMSKTAWLAALIPLQLAALAYQIVLHARYGQTLGKVAAKIRVVSAAGTPITSRQSWSRSSIDIFVSAAMTLESMLVASRVPEGAWGHGSTSLKQSLASAGPHWSPSAILALAWYVAGLLVLLFDRRSRALHDFIAGTVVVRVPAERPVLGERAA